VSAGPQHPVGPDRPDRPDGPDGIPDPQMSALPGAGEPDWYGDDDSELGVPAWETPDSGDSLWEAPDSGDPVWETLDLHDPCDDDPPQGAPFADGGWADALAPDPVLATLVDLVRRDGLGKLDDDQLTGVLQAANRLAAWCAAQKLTAVSALAARREAAGRVSGDWRPFDHADDEIAVALRLTRRSAGRLLDLALELDRLPLTRAALAAGLIDERRAEVIAEELAGLDDADAAAVEKLIIGAAPGLTSGQLRALVRRAVLSADPKAARRRKDKALKDARVEMFPETAGTAALAGRDLPPAAVLAADKHLTALAQAMKAAGQPGTLDILRAWAYLHLLSGKPAATLIPAAQAATSRGAAAPGVPSTPGGVPGTPGSMPGTPGGMPGGPAGGAPGTAGGGPHSEPSGGTGPLEMPRDPDAGTHFPAAPGPQTSGACALGSDGIPASPGLRGTVNLTMPLSAWLGWTEAPGDVPGYGPVDAEDSRTLAGQLARTPGNRWCITLTDTAGHPVAHACARHGPGGKAGRGGPSLVGPSPGGPGDRAGPATPNPGTPSAPSAPAPHPRGPTTAHPCGPTTAHPPGPTTAHPPGPTAAHPPGPTTAASASPVPDWLCGLTFSTLETGTCTHPRQSRGYQPGPAMRHLIHIRNPTCTGPGCRRAATRCDLDHVIPYHQGGPTCECNLHPASKS
jgi:Domain of unknown function (DUF222)